MTQPLVVWTEIPVRDVARAAAFFDAVLGTTTTVDSSGPQPMANIGDAMDGVGCSLFEGDPAGFFHHPGGATPGEQHPTFPGNLLAQCIGRSQNLSVTGIGWVALARSDHANYGF